MTNGLKDELVETLELNLQFWRESPEDQQRYFAGPEVVQALAWVATTLAVPVLLTGANEIVKKRVGEWLERRKTNQSSAPLDELDRELAEVRPSVDPGSVTAEHEAQAATSVAEYLGKRGWPRPMAEHDAREIVAVLKGRLQ